jgi:Fe2+ transport system protein FeoA
MGNQRLSELGPGYSAVVIETCSQSAVGRRLLELGFVPGATVDVIRQAPFAGPKQYRVRGVSLSMRSSEANCIQVTPLVIPAARSGMEHT